MVDTEYLTQMLLSSKNGEDPVVFFRRIQKIIWESLFLFFPEVDNDGADIYKALPFEDFSNRHHINVCLTSQDYVEGRYLETARLCSHGITLSRKGPCAVIKGASDNTFKTEICIESAKNKTTRFPGVRFSYSTKITYQPFAGFYPLASKEYETPDLIKKILQVPNVQCEFFPRIDQIDGRKPKFTYPVSDQIFYIDTHDNAMDFLNRLNDPARPIPFLVFMGKTNRMCNEAAWLLPRVFTKCYIYVVEESQFLKGIEKIVTGIDVRKNFRKSMCRVFFPFGKQYMHDDFANPSYQVQFFERNREKNRNLIMNGLLRFFDLNAPGWNRTQRDVHMRQLDLQEERQFLKKVAEVEDSRDALSKKQEIINTILDARKSELEKIESERKEFNDERKLYEEENTRLTEANKKLDFEKVDLRRKIEELKCQNSDLKGQLEMWQGNEPLTGQIDFKVKNLFPNEINDHVAEIFEKALCEIDTTIMTRKRQILESLTKVCKKTGTLEQRRKDLEKVLRANKGLSEGDFAVLRRLGFICEHGGKHDKITLGEISFTVSCTPGDKSRHWKNQISDSRKVFF